VSALSGAGAICAPVRELADAWSQPRLTERELLVTLAPPGFDSFPVPVMSLARTVEADGLPAGPRLGEHTESVLGELGIR
jgi:crotonobetainyl-CoA:carnitine CoA-transferase CaiB-like acyl-CoA transferase